MTNNFDILWQDDSDFEDEEEIKYRIINKY